ncbi:hypothetical protein ACNA06_07465 [Lysinibacillus sp. RSDA_15]
MEIIKLDVQLLTNIIKMIVIFLFLSAIMSLFMKTKLNIIERYLSMFKLIFYAILATLTYFLNVTVVGEEILMNFGIPKELTIGQSLLILLSVLEALSNLVTMLRVPKGEYHLVSWQEYNDSKTKERFEKIKIYQHIGNLEREVELIKLNNTGHQKNKKKKIHGKRRRVRN